MFGFLFGYAAGKGASNRRLQRVKKEVEDFYHDAQDPEKRDYWQKQQDYGFLGELHYLATGKWPGEE